MKRIACVMWSTLVLYTGLFLLVTGINAEYIREILTLQADPYLIAIFSMLGIWPIAFVIYAIEHFDYVSKQQLFWLLGGFALGAFSILVFFKLESKDKISLIKYRSRLFRYLGRLLIILTVILMLYALWFGDYSFYYNAFTQSTLVHIMTIDFISLSVFSVILINKHERFINKSVIFSIIPLIGFLFFILDSKRTNS